MMDSVQVDDTMTCPPWSRTPATDMDDIPVRGGSTTTGDKDVFNAYASSMSLDDVALNLPAATPITRSLSKSTHRDATTKHAPAGRAQVIDRAEDDISVQPPAQTDCQGFGYLDEYPILPADQVTGSACSPIEQLPTEILESIIDYVGGQLGSPAASRNQESGRNWNAILRHPRRKNISDLALVSPTWRHMVQERIFRHIKIQGTQMALAQCGDFFLNNPHLQRHVRHLQVIVPIWETKGNAIYQRQINMEPFNNPTSMTRGLFGGPYQHFGVHDQAELSHIFRPASQNASLSEIFASAQVLFPDLHALTIEGGHCKRPPQIRFFSARPVTGVLLSDAPQTSHHSSFRVPALPGPSLPSIWSVKVLILKGAWNIVRSPSELKLIHRALPNIQEFHCTYHAPKTDAYTTMCMTLRPDAFPRSLRHLNVCLEGLYSKNAASLAKWRKVYPVHHICRDIGTVMPQLESLTYTGRLCGALFSTAIKAAEQLRSGTTRLKRIDIIVQNVCRDTNANNDGTGVHNWPFIQAFEMLIIQAMRALTLYTEVRYLRVRFIDLDSPDPLLNPAFHMEGGHAWGLWSPEILHLLNYARPAVQFEGARYGELFGVNDHSGMTSASAGGHWRRSHSVEYYNSIAQSLGRGFQ